MSLAIVSLGTALPPTLLSQDEALRLCQALLCPTEEQATWIPEMYAGTGIRTRHVVLARPIVQDALEGTEHSGSVFLPLRTPEDRGPTTGQRMQHYAELAPPLALQAAQRALDASSRPAERVTHLVTVSCTGFVAPGVDRALIEGLGLPATVARTHVGYMGCHGALNGLRVARAFAHEPGTCVLVCAVELCSLHYHYTWNPGKMIANALFGDGAAALVGVPAAEGAPDAWQLTASGSCLIPNSADAMTWTVGDHGFEMTLSRQVPALIGKHLRVWLDRWLSSHGLDVRAVRSWAVHPGGPRIVQAVEQALHLPAEATRWSREVLAECGNVSSPTLLFILERMMRAGVARPCVALGFGPGLVAEAALFT